MSKKNRRPNPQQANQRRGPKKADVLEVDKPIAGQAFGCFSFISPEDIIKKREEFYFEEFVKQWDMMKSMEKIYLFINFIAHKYKLVNEKVLADLEEFVKDQRAEFHKDSHMIANDYKTFLDKNETELKNKFQEQHEFQTSVRAIKARGNYATEAEARARAKEIREEDPNFDVFVGPIGTWLPWNPDAYKTGDVQYMESELNDLVHEKIKNEKLAKTQFEEYVRTSKQNAIEENKRKADAYNVTLTQDIDAEGNLFGTSTQETKMAGIQNLDVETICNELFTGDVVVPTKPKDT